MLRIFNLNTLHNFLNIMIGVVSVWGLFDWSTVGIQPTTALKIVGAMGLLKLTLNAIRDGVKGLVEPQPPIKANV